MKEEEIEHTREGEKNNEDAEREKEQITACV